MISNMEYEISHINEVLEDFDNFGSSLSFKRNRDSLSHSFGSKKYRFKDELKDILSKMKIQATAELDNLKSLLEEL